ncbi:MAG TPA: cytochrome c biogenesis CcdA family protein [Acidimicrobiales bacterium]|nr:cytochrome c biogenesis CcdA family protein [Acidimicrobiales bacterium]
MIEVPLAYAFTVGMVAAVNPCGFPMLPAYLSYFIGLDDERADGGGRVPRALAAAAAVSAGFLVVFSALGIPINAGVTSIYRWMPWLTIVIGLGLVGLGGAMLLGYRLKVALPRLDRGGGSRQFGSMFLFGVSYAIASLSCTLPLFLTVVAGTTERSNPLSGLFAFGAYALGMSVVLMVLSVALALARESMVRRVRAALQYVDRVAGVLLVLVGAYLVYYGVWARDPLNATTSPFGAVERWSADMAGWLGNGGVGLGLTFAGVVVAAVVGGALLHRRERHDLPGAGHEVEGEGDTEPVTTA